MATEGDRGPFGRTPAFPYQVSVMVSAEQARLLLRIADERQLSMSALLREAVRMYLATVSKPVAHAQ